MLNLDKWYRKNYAGSQITDFQNKGTPNSPARLSFVFKVPLQSTKFDTEQNNIYKAPFLREVWMKYYEQKEGGHSNNIVCCLNLNPNKSLYALSNQQHDLHLTKIEGASANAIHLF